jgi:hypothetical protein
MFSKGTKKAMTDYHVSIKVCLTIEAVESFLSGNGIREVPSRVFRVAIVKTDKNAADQSD